ncbi:putative NADPH dehydrogenase [Venustampulla echinocandica]|uniref:Putative NADPH dehydrogenase n=1 Tax=Venustampulla echinocandica TaxID=2656787 RepID=A0A370TSV2_9HELO|nr:putative NADPH dehydrogenase [Venustampulla echinocandica]RDL38574.1 putative NADPH dehydrogenase [Venustampulla echinocandica]
MTSNLFKPLKIGKAQLENRIVLAPLTRFRADDSHVPLPFVSDYYVQRASTPGTLLITEATFIAPHAGGMPNVPGIWNQDQIEGWKKVVEDVHAKGSLIYLQLWALGRAANEDNLKAELGPSATVKSSSNIPIEGSTVPTPLTEDEIVEYVGLYAQAAKNAIAAGFDGVEIHGANGYLVDQFTQDVSNNRTDKWGGSVENRARFGLEVASAVVNAVGADRTGIRLSPYSSFQSMRMQDPVPQFSYLVQELKKLKLAYLHLVTPRVSGIFDAETTETVDFLVDIWGKTSPVLLAGGFTPELALKTVNEEQYKNKDIAIVFGRYFISNPDLVFKIREGIALTKYDRSTFYKNQSIDGYTTYPFSEEFEARSRVQALKI